MGLFRPYERSDKASRQSTSTVAPKQPKQRTTEPAVAPEPKAADGEKIKVTRGKKSGPTPTRREAEAARMERLHPTRTRKEQKRLDRETRFKRQQEAWDRVERSPERVLLRDFVDTRWTVAEFLMPVMILIMALMFVFLADPVISFYISVTLWFIFLLAVINIWIMWRSFKRLLTERVPGASTKGLLMYMINRAMMIRRFRRPAPRIARGDDI